MTPGYFSIFDTHIPARVIIEASAGTGKTYTIVGLVVRLLLEKRISIDKLLVVTFTKMATKELKERVLNRLRQSYLALNGKVSDKDDPFIADLIEFSRDIPDAALLLNRAITDFDDANIYTIHGFCQQVLTEESLLTGSPLDMEVTQSDDLLLEAAEDFWRNFVHHHSGNDTGRFLISQIMKFGETPGELLNTLKPLFRHLSVLDEAHTETKDPDVLLKPVLDLRKKMLQLWQKENESIIRELIESDVSRMTERSVRSRFDSMDTFLNDLAYMEKTFDQLLFFTPSYHSENLKKNGSKLPGHSFFGLCESYLTQVETINQVQSWFLKCAAEDIWKLRQQKRADSSQFTYDDLLYRLEEALSNSPAKQTLAHRLREKYPVALVDEFQDTDPVQFEILDKIYPRKGNDTAFLMIGDPKQSIYSFRGADLYSYLKARNRVNSQAVHTLQHNFRSRPQLLAALNRLFDREHKSPFLDEEIPYIQIAPGGSVSDQDFRQNEDSAAPLSVCYLNMDAGKSELKKIIFNETARQIRDLINKGRNGEIALRNENAKGENVMRRLQSGDIAVLVHSNKDASLVKSWLKQYGVGAVTYSRDKVFETREAKRLEQLFSAIVNPADPTVVHTALATGFFGHELSMLYRTMNDENEISKVIEQFQLLRQIWLDSELYAMMRCLLFKMDGLVKLSILTDSERVISNIMQLVELASKAEREHQLKPPGLLRWLRNKITEATDDEEETLRLESDENLVKVSTIHNSKGLEFPVVFCPTLWEGKDMGRRKTDFEIYHEEQDPYEIKVHIDQSDSSGREEARQKAIFEEVAEDVRKTYVALTRAKYECRFFWTDHSNTNISGIGAMLSGEEKVKRYIRDKITVKNKNGLPANVLREKIEKLFRSDPQLFSFQETEPVKKDPAEVSEIMNQAKLLNNKPYQGPLKLLPRRKKFSFSSLQRNETASDIEPDYDQQLDEFIRHVKPGEIVNDKVDIFHFPRGKRAGTFIHKLFENDKFDFRVPDNPDYIDTITEEQLIEFGFDEKWNPVIEDMLKQVAAADYGSLELNQVSPDQILKEMQFHFPVANPSIETIAGIIRENRQASGFEYNDLDYMTGFIDLIVRQNGIYYLIDYKSNFLGTDLQDYHPDRLSNEMKNSGYDIQYHIYTVALLKYLRQRIPSFSYEKHFGGIYYLFVRGIRKHSKNGIYFHKPGIETIEILNKELGRQNDKS